MLCIFSLYLKAVVGNYCSVTEHFLWSKHVVAWKDKSRDAFLQVVKGWKQHCLCASKNICVSSSVANEEKVLESGAFYHCFNPTLIPQTAPLSYSLYSFPITWMPYLPSISCFFLFFFLYEKIQENLVLCLCVCVHNKRQTVIIYSLVWYLVCINPEY